MDKEVLSQFSYGLYIVCSQFESKESGCVVNSVMQLTDSPLQIGVAINKKSYTHDLIQESHRLTISILDDTSSFDLIKHFGFSSGKDKNKFLGMKYGYDAYGVIYLRESINGYLSVEVHQEIDLGSHTYFIGSIKNMKKLSYFPSLTYRDYHEKLKPKKGYRCKVCGYIYEGKELPQDYICPVCKQGSEVFEKIDI